MLEVFRAYHVNEATWLTLSLPLIIALFGRFSRWWSLRNLDLILLLAIAPGVRMVRMAPEGSAAGYAWLFGVTGCILVRLLFDQSFTRRPRLENNLNAAGMCVLCLAALGFQTSKIMTEEPDGLTVQTVRRADELLNRQDTTGQSAVHDDTEEVPVGSSSVGPASKLLATPVVPLAGGVETAAARLLAFLAHLAVGLGLIMVGRWHFSDTRLGLGMATLYLLLPATVFDVTRVTHLLPAALITWAIAFCGRPLVAGLFLGFACGSMFFAAFLLPLWMAYYWGRGAMRFATALCWVAVVLMASLTFTAADTHSFTRQIVGSIDWSALKFDTNEGIGFWSLCDPAYRIPVFVAFVLLIISLTIWPAQKTVEHLLASSAAIVVATQFWYPHQGGIYILWYLPLLLIVVFRPRLLPAQPDVVAVAAMRANESPERPAIGLPTFRSQAWR